MSNIVEAMPRIGMVAKTKPLWQYDSGQIIRVSGITLPATYKAEFSNSTRGNAVPTVQTTDEITVPAQFLQSGNPVYIWLVVVDENSRTTEYAIMAPVTPRSQPTDDTPTPEEQSEIDQAIAALNTGVETVQGIADAIPETINTALAAAKASGEFDGPQGDKGDKGDKGDTGATGAQGPQGIQGVQGPKGDKGDKGDTGSQGPKGDTGATGPAGPKGDKGDTGAQGPQGVQGIQGPKGETGAMGQTGPQGATGETGPAGADGTTFTPAVDASGNLSWTNDGGKTNPQTVNIKGPQGETGPAGQDGQNGQDGAPGVGIPSGGTDGQMIVKDGSTDYATKWANQPSVPVQDVQVNGTSILNNGVANVPIATASTPGVVKVAQYIDGLYIKDDNSLSTYRPTSEQIKSGTQGKRPITPFCQHESTFYGLAKAAGADMASSSNAVGTYTDAAKVAIQIMLGISAIIGTVEAGTASKPYAVGDIFLHSGALYKASSAIGAGDAIVPGTNCAQTTIIEMLKGA